MTKIYTKLLVFSNHLYWKTIITIHTGYQHCCLVNYTSWRWGSWPWKREWVVVFWRNKDYQWKKLVDKWTTQDGCYVTLLKNWKETQYSQSYFNIHAYRINDFGVKFCTLMCSLLFEVLQSPVPSSILTKLDLIQISRGVVYHMSVPCVMTEDRSECH